ncbi:MAG: response regulator transcription factor [Chloroflexi bacterium]|nr:response regulator transcription factor [Chloroflexota bacterium]
MRILLVDDSPLFRRGLAGLLTSCSDVEAVSEAGDGLEAVEKARDFLPDVILMDIFMPRCDGLEATRLIKEELPYVKIVMLTVSDDEQHLFETIKAGAEGYVLKNVEPEALFQMLRGISRGEAPVSPSMAAKILAELAQQHRGGGLGRAPQEPAQLTEREREVLQLLTQGHSNKEIAAILSVSQSAVKNRLRNIMDKLHVYNRIQAALKAIEQGQISPPSRTPRDTQSS